MKTSRRFAALALAGVAVVAMGLAVPAAHAIPDITEPGSTGKPVGDRSKDAIFSTMPATLPPSVPSLGFQATQTAEFGDAVTFAPGTGRVLKSVSVLMVSWACESGGWSTGDCVTTPGSTFTHPISLTLYGADGSTVLAKQTKTFTLPYRPSPDPTCPSPSQWRDPASGSCQNGYATKIEFTFKKMLLPDSLVYGVAFNTNTWGYAPLGASGPYESLNVGVTFESTPFVGTETVPTGGWWAGGSTPVFAGDLGWDYNPIVQFKASTR